MMGLGKLIAIDGPSASGKSSVARGVAEQLSFLYVDSGALYRGVTWLALQSDVDGSDEAAVTQVVNAAAWHFFVESGAVTFSINEVRPGVALRGKEVREAVSRFAALPRVRSFVVERLRSHAQLGSLVIEGRDIGSAVFPDTPLKFYLDADPQERAMRRHRELMAAGESEKAEEVLLSLKRRDEIDLAREHDPLRVPSGAVRIDSTSLSLKEVIEVVINRVAEC
ncbi:MAG: (d)CMP kinase [Pontiellaceae bacterium]